MFADSPHQIVIYQKNLKKPVKHGNMLLRKKIGEINDNKNPNTNKRDIKKTKIGKQTILNY